MKLSVESRILFLFKTWLGASLSHADNRLSIQCSWGKWKCSVFWCLNKIVIWLSGWYRTVCLFFICFDAWQVCSSRNRWRKRPSEKQRWEGNRRQKRGFTKSTPLCHYHLFLLVCRETACCSENGWPSFLVGELVYVPAFNKSYS